MNRRTFLTGLLSSAAAISMGRVVAIEPVLSRNGIYLISNPARSWMEDLYIDGVKLEFDDLMWLKPE